MIIGIDHGYGFIKTKNSIFASSVAEFSKEPPVKTRVVKYEGKYFQAGCTAQGLAGSKTEDDKYYILTLAAIAEELKSISVREACILLAVGIPLTRYGIEKDELIKYLTREKTVFFSYEDTDFKISIENVYVYPQGYAAIAPRLYSIKGGCSLIDIGTGTTEIVPITSEHIVDLSRAKTLQFGITNLIAAINEEISRTYQTELSTDYIIDIISGRDIDASEAIMEICNKEMKAFCEKVLNLLRQNKINYEFMQTYIMGGGAGIMKEHGGIASTMVNYITDIKANVIGYEVLAKAAEKIKKQEAGEKH